MSDVVDRLRQRRDRVWNEAVELAERAADENRAFTPDEQTQYESREAELTRLDERIGAMLDGEQRAKESERRFRELGGDQRPVAGRGRHLSTLQDGDLDERFRRAIVDKNPAPIEVHPNTRRSWYQPGVEYRSMLEAGLEQRVLTKGTATQALPVDVYDRVIMHLIENTAILAAGATLINTETGENLQVPKSTAYSAAALTAEGSAIAAGDPTLAISTLGAFKYATLFQVTRELALDSQSDILGYLAREAAVALGTAYGPHLITGTGSSQPQGVVTGAGTGVTGPVGTTVSLGAQTTAGMGTDLLYSLIGSVAEPYARQPAAGFVMTNASLQIARKLKDSTGQPVAAATMGVGSTGAVSGMPNPNQLLGYPVHIDPSVAQMAANAKSIVFGDFSRYFVRIAGGVRYERSDDFAFSSDLITFRCIIRLDGQLVDANGLKVFVNSAT